MESRAVLPVMLEVNIAITFAQVPPPRAPTARKSWTLRIAPVAAGAAVIQPTHQPVSVGLRQRVDRDGAVLQARDSFSPENQRRLNQEAAARNGEHIPPEFHFSDCVTARKDVYRPGFEKAIRVLLDGRIRTLYVAKVDRLTRRGTAQVGMILDELEKVGGRIVFVAEGLDSSKPGARQIIAILAEQARAEADAISWRIGQRRPSASSGLARP